MTTGIDAVAYDIAKIYLPIKTLAHARDIDPDKLEKGLGLLKMTLPDVHQDTVVFGANALTRLITDNNLDPADIARIYVGTESGIDSSKPIGSYLVALMEQKFGHDSFLGCDTVDFTFACIGAVDALHNCIDFVRLNPTKKAIVIATDIAKYDLESTGEYTQGAGAVALLVTANPRILAIENNWAVSTKGVFDFFKPYRTIKKSDITNIDANEPWFGNLEAVIEIHKDQPVFDGQYSNTCYTDRTREAYNSFKKLTNTTGSLYNTWEAIVMHLPYAFQGRRMFAELFALDAETPLLTGNEDPADYQTRLREISKSDDYRAFVSQKLQLAEPASSLIGNLYTGSIFMGLLSVLAKFAANDADLDGKKIGFLAYGSGSKSKVFEGVLQPGWKAAAQNARLFETLEQSTAIDFDTYQKLHKKEQQYSVLAPVNEWVLDAIEHELPNLVGARYYKWVE
ncbi:hydroxymethylglutaryl-CoA synthase [Flavobacterium sp. Sd200]|uniref:hydroxymethylglutaryl-CoA synthase family protein n=1 Tax=Flavobacterium sp. Sd200 TaxID=2692211 RepID=UPI001367DD9E|nr:hydroxymethylglutaryl-CoA synthase [Flavobacterium sp. Sd200]MXN91316.1 hydroxymethylglutaryl-CoA synthase [Flavobacterium sp. Sd200]